MAARIQLEIQGTTNFTFDVEGEYVPRIVPVYKTNANPPELSQLLVTWEFKGCKIRASDGTLATLWSEYSAFLVYLEDRDNHPTYVRLVVPGGATLLTLGPSDYEQFQIELVAGGQDRHSPDNSWNTTATVDVRVSAVRKFADADGIVDFDQTVTASYTNALRTLEWDTTIVTAEGTSAVTKAQTYAALAIASIGSDYSYLTNGPDGIEYEYTDADENNSRTPTICRARSVVKQWGISTGATTAGGSPDTFDYKITTSIKQGITTTITEAAAGGPNALAWVTSKKPKNGSFKESVVTDSQAENTASARWVQTDQSADTKVEKLKMTITGGARKIAFRQINNGYPPLQQNGGFTPFRLQMEVSITNEGTTELSDYEFPGLLGPPWIVDLNESSETYPMLTEKGEDETQNKYERSASVVFWSPTKPKVTPDKDILEGFRFESYFF